MCGYDLAEVVLVICSFWHVGNNCFRYYVHLSQILQKRKSKHGTFSGSSTTSFGKYGQEVKEFLRLHDLLANQWACYVLSWRTEIAIDLNFSLPTESMGEITCLLSFLCHSGDFELTNDGLYDNLSHVRYHDSSLEKTACFEPSSSKLQGCMNLRDFYVRNFLVLC